jgi:hypothetical protein
VAVTPARVVPVAAQVGLLERDGHQMADALVDLLVAAGAEVALGRLVRMDPADLELVLYRGIRAHRRSRATIRNAAATYT